MTLPPTLRAEFAAPRLELWGLPALFTVLACHALAVVLFVVGWYGASQQATPEEQVAWGNLAAMGLLLVAGAHVGWLLSGRRAVGRRSRALARAVPGVVAPVVAAPVLEPAAPAVYVTALRSTRFHEPGCPLTTERSVEDVALDAARSRGLRPCGMCDPLDQP